MTDYRALLPLFTCLGLLGACAAAPEQVAEPGLKRVWMVSEWPGFTREALTAAQARLDLSALPHGGAYMGCNRLMFQVADVHPLRASGSLNIGPVTATRMHCPGRMDLEQAFSQHFHRFQHYRLSGHRLTLEDAEGNTIRLIAQDWD